MQTKLVPTNFDSETMLLWMNNIEKKLIEKDHEIEQKLIEKDMEINLVKRIAQVVQDQNISLISQCQDLEGKYQSILNKCNYPSNMKKTLRKSKKN